MVITFQDSNCDNLIAILTELTFTHKKGESQHVNANGCNELIYRTVRKCILLVSQNGAK